MFELLKKKIDELETLNQSLSAYSSRQRQNTRIEGIPQAKPKYQTTNLRRLDLESQQQDDYSDFFGPIRKALDKGSTGKNFIEGDLLDKASAFSAEALHSFRHPIESGMWKKKGELEGGIVKGTANVLQSAYNPLSWIHGAKRVLGIAKEDDPIKNILDKQKKGVEIALSEFVSGLSGRMIEPTVDNPEERSVLEKINAGASNIAGMAIGIGKIKQGLVGIANSKPAMMKFMTKYPMLYKHIAPFVAYGQMDPKLAFDIKKRTKQLATDAVLGAVFSKTSKLNWSGVPVSFGLGFGLAKLSGADTEDAIISGGLLAVLHGAGIYNNGMSLSSGEVRNNLTIDSKIVEKSKNASSEAKQYANNVLEKGNEIKIAEEPSTLNEKRTQISNIVKGKREGYKYSGDVMAAREIKNIDMNEIKNENDLYLKVSDIVKDNGIKKEIQDYLKTTKEKAEYEAKDKMAFNINIEKYSLNKEVEAKYRKFVSSMESRLRKNKGEPLTNSEIRKEMKNVGIEKNVKTREQTKEEIAKIKNAQERLREILTEEEKLNATGEDISQDMLQEKAALTEVLSSQAASYGRGLNSFRMMVEKRSFFEDIIQRASKEGKDVKKIVSDMENFDLNNPDQFIKFYRKQFPATWREVFDELRYSFMLSSPRSSYKNISWGAIQTLAERPLELTFSNPKSVPNYFKGLFGSWEKAKGDFINSWKQNDFIIKGEVTSKNRVPTTSFSKYWNWGPRFMEASDHFISAFIKGGEMSYRIKQGAKPESAMVEADRISETLLGRRPFNKENKKYQGPVSNMIDSVGRLLDQAKTGSLVARVVIPFVRTILQIAKFQYQSSIFGVSELINKSARKELAGRVITGSIITSLGALKALSGETTWNAPTNDTRKKAFYDSGRKPYSVKIGDKWIPMAAFGPWAFALSIPAAAMHYQEQSESAYSDNQLEKIGKTALSLAGSFIQNTPVGPAGDFLELFSNNEGAVNKATTTAAEMTTQIIPFVGLAAWLSDIFDPTMRQAKSGVDSIKRKLPFIKEQLEPYLDMSGFPVEYDWSHFVLPYDLGSVNKGWDEWFNEMMEEARKSKKIQKKMKEFNEEDRKLELKNKGFIK